MNKLILFSLILPIIPYVGGLISYNSLDEDGKNCICVPYWQCKEDFSGLIDNAVEVMDIRVYKNNLNAIGPCVGDFDVCCQIQCGKRRQTTTFPRSFTSSIFGIRILGDNNEADFGEFPWMLGILERRAFRCGASLIHPQVALTAAHCVTKPGMYKIRAGEWNWESEEEPQMHQDRIVRKAIIHPLFNPRTLHNDIALLILETPFQLSENVGMMCLPPANSNFDYNSCIAAGWGKNSYERGSYQSILKKIQLPIIPNPYCMQSLRFSKMGPLFNLHHSFICAGGEMNKDTCKGDGGSPLVCPLINEPDRFQQVGIVAWGLTCGLINTPGVYVNVPLFRNWIDEVMLRHNFDVNVYQV